ncbi:MAG: translation elongation factor Ts [Bdellovibrionales bacterium]|nr:translation elongation factor Ts [Bdellovibrionales bacterium]
MSLEEIKHLRAKTGAGVLDCKKAWEESGQDFNKALEWLKKKGLARAEKKSLRQAKEGKISAYLHGQGRIGVLVEVNVETDFAARGEVFKEFTHQLCLHIAAMDPLFVKREEVPKERVKKEEAIFRAQVEKEGKKEVVRDKIVKGKMEKWFSEICLLEQVFLISAQSDEIKTVEAALKDIIAQLGENVCIRRFVRFELGEEIGPLPLAEGPH